MIVPKIVPALPFDQELYTKLRKRLVRWVALGHPGAQENLEAVDALSSKAAKLKMLKTRLGEGPARTKKPDPANFAPSPGHSVAGRVEIVKFTDVCVKKGIRNSAPACATTCQIYALLRQHDIEQDAHISVLEIYGYVDMSHYVYDMYMYMCMCIWVYGYMGI